MRPPLSLDRMSFDEQGCVVYRAKPSRPFAPAKTFDPADFLARLLMHIPEPRRHLVRYLGEYSSVVRARRQAEAQDAEPGAPELAPRPQTTAERRRARRAWAQMIRRIYEVDPLSCRCGGQMRIVSSSWTPELSPKSSATSLDTVPPLSEHLPRRLSPLARSELAQDLYRLNAVWHSCLQLRE